MAAQRVISSTAAPKALAMEAERWSGWWSCRADRSNALLDPDPDPFSLPHLDQCRTPKRTHEHTPSVCVPPKHKTDFTAIPTACPWEECSLEFAIPDQEDLLRKLLGDTVPDVATCSCSSTAIPSMEAAVDGTVDSSHAPTKDEALSCRRWRKFQ